MNTENFNANNEPRESSDREEMQSLGHKIAEQIASHTTTDKNGETVYIGRELPKKVQGKVEESGFENPGEQPRGTSKDGVIDDEVYPKGANEFDWELRRRRNMLRSKTNSAIVAQVEQRATEILDNDAAGAAYDGLISRGDAYDDNPSDQIRSKVGREARELAVKTLNYYYQNMLPNNPKHEQYVAQAYEDVFTDKIVKDDTNSEVTKKEIENAAIDEAIKDARRSGLESNRYIERKPSWEYQRDSRWVANELLNDHRYEIFSGLFDNDLDMPEKETQQIRHSVINTAIKSGLFMPNTTVNNPGKADAMLLNNGIEKDSTQVTAFAVDGIGEVSDERKKEIARYFDLNNKISAMMDNSDFVFRYKKGDRDELRVKCGIPYYKRKRELDEWAREERVLDPEITHVALDRLRNAANQVEESINNSPEYVEKVKNHTRRFEEDYVTDGIFTTRNSFDFGNLLDRLNVAKIDCSDRIINHYIAGRDDSESFSYVLSDYMSANKPKNPNLEVDVDYQKAIQNGLKMRLAQGVAKDGNRDIDLTRIFETQEYKDNQAKIGLDFTDDLIPRLAFTGFLNTIKTRNGEYSNEANWYYDNIFANDPGKFAAFIEAFKESSNDRGTKGKLTRFGSERGNEDFYVFLQQRERDKRPDLESRHTIKRGQITGINKNTMGAILKQYEIDLLNDWEKQGYTKIQSTLNKKTGASSGNRPNNPTTRKERETPPFDYGLEKGKALARYADFIEENIPGSDVYRFECTFKGEKKDLLPPNLMDQLELPKMSAQQKYVDAVLKDPDAYIGFTFAYEGKRCLIAESFGDDAAMYLAIEDPESGFRCLDLFDDAKSYARNLSNVVAVDHFDLYNFADSLDECYQKAFMFFITGDKNMVFPTKKGGRDNWQRLQSQQFPAWPMLFDNGAQMDDLTGYQAWQEQQMKNRDELIDEKLSMWNR